MFFFFFLFLVVIVVVQALRDTVGDSVFFEPPWEFLEGCEFDVTFELRSDPPAEEIPCVQQVFESAFRDVHGAVHALRDSMVVPDGDEFEIFALVWDLVSCPVR